MARPSSTRVFCDPVHDLISFRRPEDDLLLELVDTATFQRLRRIRQLGVTSLVFHGAEHTRFAHSLGVFHMARSILQSLERRHRHEPALRDEVARLAPDIELAALLHDAGHGPFSHLFEEAVEGGRAHEEWSVAIVGDPRSEVGRVLARGDRARPARVAAIIGRTSRSRLAVDLVSSQLDADRLDYLLRDSAMTGTGYGRFDVPWLIHALCVARAGRRAPLRLCVDGAKGIPAVEGYVLARHHMHLQVYFHKTGRAFEAQVINLLRLAGRLIRSGDELVAAPCVPALAATLAGRPLDLDGYLTLDDVTVLGAMGAWARLAPGRGEGAAARAELARQSQALCLKREPYGLLALSEAELPRARAFLAALEQEQAQGRNLLRCSVHLDECASLVYKDLVYRAARGAAPSEAAGDSIVVATDDGFVPIEEHPAARTISSLSRVSWAAQRLYFDRHHARALAAAARRHGLSLPA